MKTSIFVMTLVLFSTQLAAQVSDCGTARLESIVQDVREYAVQDGRSSSLYMTKLESAVLQLEYTSKCMTENEQAYDQHFEHAKNLAKRMDYLCLVTINKDLESLQRLVKTCRRYNTTAENFMLDTLSYDVYVANPYIVEIRPSFFGRLSGERTQHIEF